jgi:tetratricopeptide (TPR) repeat protein
MEETHEKEEMRGSEPGSCCRMARRAGHLLLVLGVALLAGCASTGKGKLNPVQAAPAAAAQPSPPLPSGPSVVHFSDGREGFVITEASGREAQLRAEFDQAGGLIKEAQYEKVIELLEKVIALSPEMSGPRINVAIAYRQVNKPEQAETHLKKALELIPGHPVASNEYGLLLRKAGRFADSRVIYEKALKAFPEYRPIDRNLGILCDLYLKDLACAVEHYQIYSKAMPKDEQVKLWLADLQSRSGQ